jgi:hypothetical protein
VVTIGGEWPFNGDLVGDVRRMNHHFDRPLLSM